MTEDAIPPPNWFTRWSVQLYQDLASRRLEKYPQLSVKLASARQHMVPAAFLARTYAHMTVAAGAGVLMFLLYVIAAGGPAGMSARFTTVFLLLPVLFAVLTYALDMVGLDMKAGERRRDLDNGMPYGLSFMAALAGAGVVPEQVFASLGQQRKIYGEVAEEARLISRDTELFGKDLVAALRDASRRSPSREFSEFLQGAVNTVTSGGNLKQYLMSRAESASADNRRRQKGFLESLGVMAESYVVVAAATPLFLIVVLSVMLVTASTNRPLLFINVVVLLALPIIHAMFAYLLRTLRAD